MEEKRYCEFCGAPMNPGENACPNCHRVPPTLVRVAYTPVKKHSLLSIIALTSLLFGLATYGITAIIGVILAFVDLAGNSPDEKHFLSKITIQIGGAIVVLIVLCLLAEAYHQVAIG